MPTALKLQEEFKDSLQVVFVETGRVDRDGMQAFAIDKGWFADGSRAMWTKEAPFDPGLGATPSFALLDDSGRVLMKGITTREHSRIVETIEQHAKARTKGPEDVPSKVAKLYGDFAKGKLGKSLSAAAALAADPGRDGEELGNAAKQAVADMEAALERELKRADWLLENGFYAAAEADLSDLAKELKGVDDWSAKVAERQSRLGGAELETERKAEEALVKLEQKVFDKGTDAVKSKALLAIGEKYPGTKAAARAAALAVVVEAAG